MFSPLWDSLVSALGLSSIPPGVLAGLRRREQVLGLVPLHNARLDLLEVAFARKMGEIEVHKVPIQPYPHCEGGVGQRPRRAGARRPHWVPKSLLLAALGTAR